MDNPNKVLKHHVSDNISRREAGLSSSERNQLEVARATNKLSCFGCKIMGGMNHLEAASVIYKLTGSIVNIDSDCTC